MTVRRRARLKPEDILWPVEERTIEAINHNFDILFRDMGLLDDVLPVIYGGTGTSSFNQGDVVVAVTPTLLGGVEAVALNNALISQGIGVVPAWGKIGLTTHVTGVLPIANGGTNANNKTDAFNNLSPLTTKGDLLAFDGNNVRKAVGTDGQFLIADSEEADGLNWRTLNISALILYFFYNAASDIAGYRDTDVAHSTGVQVDLSFAGLASGDTLLEEWITPLGEPNVDFLPDGLVHVHLHATRLAGTKTVVLYYKFYKRNALGVETLLATSEESGVLTNVEQDFDIETAITGQDIDATDRLLVKVYATVTGSGSAPTVELEIEGDTNARMEFPVPGGTGSTGVGTHELLAATTHTDTETADVVRGALIVGASLPFNGSYFWLDGGPMREIDSGVDYSEQKYWADGGVDGALGFTDPGLIRWRRLQPTRGTLRCDGADVSWQDDTVTQPRARVYRTTSQSIATGAGAYGLGTQVTFEASSFDSHSFWSSSVNPTRLTVPAGQAGIYLVIGQASWDTSATARKAAWLFKNGSRFAIAEVNGDDGGLGLSFTVSAFVALAVGDYVELVVRQDTAGALALLGDVTGQYAQLQMVRIAL